MLPSIQRFFSANDYDVPDAPRIESGAGPWLFRWRVPWIMSRAGYRHRRPPHYDLS